MVIMDYVGITAQGTELEVKHGFYQFHVKLRQK